MTESNFFSDTEYFYELAMNNFPPEKIVMYGRSLGTSVATWLVSKKSCTHLVLETPYCNMYDVARRYGMMIPDGNYLKFVFYTDRYLQDVKAPVLILHGTKDEIISNRSARKLKPLLKPNDQFIELNGRKHLTLHQFQEYDEALQAAIG